MLHSNSVIFQRKKKWTQKALQSIMSLAKCFGRVAKRVSYCRVHINMPHFFSFLYHTISVVLISVWVFPPNFSHCSNLHYGLSLQTPHSNPSGFPFFPIPSSLSSFLYIKLSLDTLGISQSTSWVLPFPVQQRSVI